LAITAMNAIKRLVPKRLAYLVLADLLVLLCAVHLAARWAGVYPSPGVLALVLFTYLFSFHVFDLFEFRRDYRRLRRFFRIETAVCNGFFFNIVLFFLFQGVSWLDSDAYLYSKGSLLVLLPLARMLFYLYGLGVLLILLPLERILYSSVAGLEIFDRKALILGTGDVALLSLQLIQRTQNAKIKVVGFVRDEGSPGTAPPCEVPIVGDSGQLMRLKDTCAMDLVIIAVRDYQTSERLIGALEACTEKGVELMDVPMLYEMLAHRIPFGFLNERWLLMMSNSISHYYLSALKRWLDIAVAVLSLTVLAPVFLVVILAIRLTSRGPIFYRQERLGRNKVPFTLIKFRTMVPDAETGTPLWAQAHDTRVTALGRLLRKFRVDEIPQFLNILRGEMSLIGPRPERAYFVESLEREIPFYGQRFRMKPGITGWAQVCYRYGSTVADAKTKFEYELYYLKNNSLLLDVMIILQTFKVVIFGCGT